MTVTPLHQLELGGCAPDPLMAYLKALGVCRVVAEQKDNEARARWRADTFLLTSSLDRDALVKFFLEEYRPTPIVSPWNGGSGFYEKDNTQAMDTILELESPRFQLWSEVISTSKEILARQGPNGKDWVLRQCRAKFPDEALAWLDVAYVLTSDGVKYPPLLGTGGNDGRLDFSNSFMQNVVLALGIEGKRNGTSIIEGQLGSALFNEGTSRLKKRSSGFYNPGSVGGPNASAGFSGESLTNPWDYVLMLEGVLLFAGAVARRLSSQASSKAVFPFTVDNSAAGYSASVDSEYADLARAEFWAPLWDRPANLRELERLTSEGRAQLGRRQASNGVNFARAIAGLGTERGVSRFQRYGFMRRNGLAYLAVPLGRFHVREGGISKGVDVLFDLDRWLESLRRAVTDGNAPAGLGAAIRRIDQAIMDFCWKGRPQDLQNVLVALGYAERRLAPSSPGKAASPVWPVPALSQEWLDYADDQTPEFRLARSVGSILPGQYKGQLQVGPVRENLEPVTVKEQAKWNDGSGSFVWTSGDVLSNMLAVLERRCLEGHAQGLRHPPLNSAYPAQLSDIAVFLNGRVDVQRMSDLALPMSFVRQRRQYAPPSVPPALPVAYATMKLTLLPGKFQGADFGIADTDIWMEPRMIAMLRGGRINEAYHAAYCRLRASGLQPLSGLPGIADGSGQARRLAAALLFPLDTGAHTALATSAVREPFLD